MPAERRHIPAALAEETSTVMNRSRFPLLSLLLAGGVACLQATDASAQPEPSFKARCGELRKAMRALDGKEGELVTIQVEGTLSAVQEGSGLVYLVLCAKPDPQVLCVTYATNDRKRGDKVVVAGTFERVGSDHVKLDPCLHHPPD